MGESKTSEPSIHKRPGAGAAVDVDPTSRSEDDAVDVVEGPVGSAKLKEPQHVERASDLESLVDGEA